VRSWANLT